MGIVLFILFFGGFLALVIGAVLWGQAMEKKRTEAFRLQAAMLGCTLDENAMPPNDATYGRLKIFQHGRSRQVRNVLRRATDRGGELLALDYRYTTGSGKSSHTYFLSIVLFRISGVSMPGFTLQPEHFVHRIIDFIGFHDIDFSEDEEFSRKINLLGDNQDAVRAFFNAELRAILAAQPDWCVDGSGEWLAFHKINYRSAPEEIGNFIEEARTLAEFFVPRRTTSGW